MDALAIPKNLEEQSLSWPEKAKALKITDPSTYVQAGEMLKLIKGVEEQIEAYWEPHIEGAKKVKAEAEANRKRLVENFERDARPLIDAEGIIKEALIAYDDAQAALAKEQQRKLEEAARRQAESQQIEEAAALEREAVATGDLLLRAAATDLLEARVETPSITVVKATPKVSGIVLKDNWQADPNVNVVELAKAIGGKKVESVLLTPNMPALNNIAKHSRGTRKIPGVKFVNKRGVSAEAR